MYSIWLTITDGVLLTPKPTKMIYQSLFRATWSSIQMGKGIETHVKVAIIPDTTLIELKKDIVRMMQITTFQNHELQEAPHCCI